MAERFPFGFAPNMNDNILYHASGVYPREGGGVSLRTWADPSWVFIRSPSTRVSSRQVRSRSRADSVSVRRSLSSAILLSSMFAWAASLSCIVA